MMVVDRDLAQLGVLVTVEGIGDGEELWCLSLGSELVTGEFQIAKVMMLDLCRLGERCEASGSCDLQVMEIVSTAEARPQGR